MKWEEHRKYYDYNYLMRQNPHVAISDEYTALAQELIDLFQPKRVLDCGCAFGWLVNSLNLQAIDTYGIDVNSAAIEHGQALYPQIKDKLLAIDIATERIPFPDNYFDLVIVREFVEHISDDRFFHVMAEIARVASTHLHVSSPMVRPAVGVSGEAYHAWQEWLKSLNDNSLQSNLSLIDNHPNLISECPHPENIEHPNTHGREFWIGLFEMLGFELMIYDEWHYPPIRLIDNMCGLCILDFKRSKI